MASTESVRDTLRRSLRERMIERDQPAVQVLRTTIAAIENAEAQPVDATSATQLYLDASPGADIERRVVSDEDARTIIEHEVDELRDAAQELRSLAAVTRADLIDGQADLLDRLLHGDR